MSSATPRDIGAGRMVIGGTETGPSRNQVLDNQRVARLGMTERQRMLNHYWSWYRTTRYDSCGMNWDGTPRTSVLDREAIASLGYVPPGFYDAGNAMGVPDGMERPVCPYALCRVIVHRFTGLLFSQRRHPKISVSLDAVGEDYARAMAEKARLWMHMQMARNVGGGMGSVSLGFKFLDGKPIVEVHDPRWLNVDFEDRDLLKVNRIEKRYMFPKEEPDPERPGMMREVWYWYRRIIDRDSDVLYAPAPVAEGDEPDWKEQDRVDHGFGFCPIVWVQNEPVLDDIDGDPDCHGAYDTFEALDRLQTKAFIGTSGNADPTLHVASNKEVPSDLRKGTGNTISTEAGGSLKYVELAGTGPKSAREYAQELRAQALEVCECVLPDPGDENAAKTATEVRRNYDAMLSRADKFREQYGEAGCKPLLEMMVEAARKLDRPKLVQVPGGGTEKQRSSVKLPPRIDPGNGQTTPRRPSQNADAEVQLMWPPYFPPSAADTANAVDGTNKAKIGGLIDQDTAVKAVAPYFPVEDVGSMKKNIEKEAADRREEMDAQMMGAMQRNGPGPQQGEQ
jgi:hypothetical protein